MSAFETSDIVGMEEKFYRPEDLTTDELLNIRTWSPSREDENREVEGLAYRIKKMGQLDPVRLILRKEEVPVIYSGNRRHRAIQLINSGLAPGVPLLKVWCVIDRSGGDPRRKAFSSNKNRMSPLDVAEFINTLRTEYGPGDAGTQEISDYTHMSKNGVMRHERLLGGGCSDELRCMLHAGFVTLETVIEILDYSIQPKEQVAILIRAKEIQNTKRRIEAPAIKRAINELMPTDAQLESLFASAVALKY
jgi:hypothetical protein